MMAQAGLEDLEIITVSGPFVQSLGPVIESTATCPVTHKVIGGGAELQVEGSAAQTSYSESLDVATNSYSISLGTPQTVGIALQAFATCALINFPMGMSMVGGIPLDIDTLSLFIGAIGVNPVITGLVAITMGGVAAQAIWYVNSRRRKD